MKRVLFSAAGVLAFTAIFAQGRIDFPMKPEMTEFWTPEVKVVTPAASNLNAPSDAIVLFDGTSQTLAAGDKRRVLQIPQEASLSGMPLNPR